MKLTHIVTAGALLAILAPMPAAASDLTPAADQRPVAHRLAERQALRQQRLRALADRRKDQAIARRSAAIRRRDAIRGMQERRDAMRRNLAERHAQQLNARRQALRERARLRQELRRRIRESIRRGR